MYCDKTAETRITWFLPERDYVTFGYLLSQIRLSVTSVHHTQSVEILAMFLGHFVLWPSADHRAWNV